MSNRGLIAVTGLAIMVGCLSAAATLHPQPSVESGFVVDLVSEISGISDPLPDLQVSPVSVRNASAFDALRLVLEHSGGEIGLTYVGNGDVPAALRRPVAASNLEGKLPELVEQLARVAGFFYRYDPSSKVLSVFQEQQFLVYWSSTDRTVVPLVKDQITRLGARDIAEDPILGALSYRAGRRDQERIQQYIDAMHSAKAYWDGADTVSAMAAPESEVVNALIEHGIRPGVISGAKAGTDIPLGQALKSMVPRGWDTNGKDADFEAKVTWEAADSWVMALNQVMSASGHIATIDWKQKEILVARASAKAPGIAGAGNTPSSRAAAAGSWSVKSGVSLRDTLREWATQAGWDVDWALDGDFQTEAANVFKGDFKAAVHGLFDALPGKVRIQVELRADNAPPLVYVTRAGSHP